MGATKGTTVIVAEAEGLPQLSRDDLVGLMALWPYLGERFQHIDYSAVMREEGVTNNQSKVIERLRLFKAISMRDDSPYMLRLGQCNEVIYKGRQDITWGDTIIRSMEKVNLNAVCPQKKIGVILVDINEIVVAYYAAQLTVPGEYLDIQKLQSAMNLHSPIVIQGVETLTRKGVFAERKDPKDGTFKLAVDCVCLSKSSILEVAPNVFALRGKPFSLRYPDQSIQPRDKGTTSFVLYPLFSLTMVRVALHVWDILSENNDGQLDLVKISTNLQLPVEVAEKAIGKLFTLNFIIGACGSCRRGYGRFTAHFREREIVSVVIGRRTIENNKEYCLEDIE